MLVTICYCCFGSCSSMTPPPPDGAVILDMSEFDVGVLRFVFVGIVVLFESLFTDAETSLTTALGLLFDWCSFWRCLACCWRNAFTASLCDGVSLRYLSGEYVPLCMFRPLTKRVKFFLFLEFLESYLERAFPRLLPLFLPFQPFPWVTLIAAMRCEQFALTCDLLKVNSSTSAFRKCTRSSNGPLNKPWVLAIDKAVSSWASERIICLRLEHFNASSTRMQLL